MVLPLGMAAEAEWISPPDPHSLALHRTFPERQRAAAEVSFHLKRPGVRLEQVCL
jgi:hypothetical protein